MVLITEEKLRAWIKPASDSEENRCDATIENIKNCIKNYSFAQLGQPLINLRGSYNNNTNVKNDSDVDMYALFDGYCYNVAQNFQLIHSYSATGPSYTDFNRAVYLCLTQKYGAENITVGNKSLKVKNNSYKVKADIVPVVTAYYKGINKIKGVAFFSAKNEFILNFPQQDYENGCQKNVNTSNRYKYCVRIFKRFRNELEDEGVLTSKIPSYVIESLLYNVPDRFFSATSYIENVYTIVNYLLDRIDFSNFVEVNQIKNMFSPHLFPEQKTTRMEIKRYLQLIKLSMFEELAA